MMVLMKQIMTVLMKRTMTILREANREENQFLFGFCPNGLQDCFPNETVDGKDDDNTDDCTDGKDDDNTDHCVDDKVDDNTYDGDFIWFLRRVCSRVGQNGLRRRPAY